MPQKGSIHLDDVSNSLLTSWIISAAGTICMQANQLKSLGGLMMMTVLVLFSVHLSDDNRHTNSLLWHSGCEQPGKPKLRGCIEPKGAFCVWGAWVTGSNLSEIHGWSTWPHMLQGPGGLVFKGGGGRGWGGLSQWQSSPLFAHAYLPSTISF